MSRPLSCRACPSGPRPRITQEQPVSAGRFTLMSLMAPALHEHTPSHVHTHTYAGEAHPGLPRLYRGFSHRSGPSIAGAPLANLGGAGKVRLRLPPAPPKVPSGQLVSACWLPSRVSSLATNASWRGRGPGDRPPP